MSQTQAPSSLLLYLSQDGAVLPWCRGSRWLTTIRSLSEGGREGHGALSRTAPVFTFYLTNTYLVPIMYFISIGPRKPHYNLLFTHVLDKRPRHGVAE